MLYLYDNALVEDLKSSFNEESNVVVKAVASEDIISIAAQIRNDEISLPMIALVRSENWKIDTQLSNFTRIHRGVAAVFDPKTNNIYSERAIPINLSYTLCIIASNVADVDELCRELLYKYASMYFLSIMTPYECNRQIRFGVRVDSESTVDKISSQGDYLQAGKLYQTNIPLVCDGAVLLTYTPAHLIRTSYDVEAYSEHQINDVSSTLTSEDLL